MTSIEWANESNSVTVGDRVIRVEKYHTEAFARRASGPGTKHTLILGDIDDRWGRWWVVLNRYAGHLERSGFEYAPL